MLSNVSSSMSEAFRRVAVTASLPVHKLYSVSTAHAERAEVFNAAAASGDAHGLRFLRGMELVSRVKLHAIR